VLIVAIAGEDFAVIAGDTRLTDGQYGINTRYAPKVWDVGDNIVITANGYSADGDTLVKRISQKIEVLQSHSPVVPFTSTIMSTLIPKSPGTSILGV
jgi:20S proteasome alpha/beta subunit